MKKLEIEVVERIRVGDYFFNTREEAQAYIDQEINSDSIFQKNYNLLTNFKSSNTVAYIPVSWKDEDGHEFFDFLFEDGDSNSGIHWRGFFHCSSLRYLKSELNIVEWDYVWAKLDATLDDSHDMDASDMGLFYIALSQKSMAFTIANKHPTQIFELFGKLRITPVYIHD